MEHRTESGKLFTLIVGDITRVPADAIVNAANSALAGGGGVDGAIHRAGGPTLTQQLDGIRAKIGHCPTGGAVVTSAGHLPGKYVIHAVGPRYRDGKHGEPEQLASCYRTAFSLGAERQVRSISFPAISTGIYGYPLEEAAEIAVKTILEQLKSSGIVEEAILVVYDQHAYKAHAAVLRKIVPEEDARAQNTK